MDENTLSKSYKENVKTIESALRLDKSFDIIKKDLIIGKAPASMYFVDGFIKDEVMEKVNEFLLSAKPDDLKGIKDMQDFSDAFMSYTEVSVSLDADKIVTDILSGNLCLLIKGITGALIIDVRTYPAREPSEPEDDRALRGARDGFVETLVANTALIRRRIRDPSLTMESVSIGKLSKTDVVICYMESTVNRAMLKRIRSQLEKITIPSLTLGQESLAECLIKGQWYNPFPKVRYTERPDSAAASVLEGKIAVIVDNSPAVMLLPTSIFDFTQDSNDYYFPPFIGTYLRLLRILIFFITVFFTPIWYFLMQNESMIPEWLSFIKVAEPNDVPLFFQLLIIELVIDGLRLASLNTPSSLGNSLSIIGALILGDFAVKSQWFVNEVVFYMAFVAIANFTQPSYELGYAAKLSRLLLLTLTWLFGGWGLLLGVAGLCVILATTKTVTGKTYLYPLIPFNGKALLRLFIRMPLNRFNSGDEYANKNR